MGGWESLVTPVNLRFLGQGLLVTLWLVFLTAILSLVAGLLLGLCRTGMSGVWRALPILVIDGLRNIPQLVLIFYMRFGPPAVGVHLDSFTAAVLALTLYNTACFAELTRAGIQSVPKGQKEAARALGMGVVSTYAWIILPQGMRNMLPTIIGQLVVLVQGTALVSAIGVIELTGAGFILFSRYANPLETLALIGLIYFLVDFSLSYVRTRLARRLGYAGAATTI